MFKRKIWPLLLLVSLGVISCSDKYQAFRKNYPFRSVSGKPDYSDLNYWAAHPWKKDLSDSMPAALANETKDSLADVFFIHPTTFTKRKKRSASNAAIDDDYINAKTDYSTILYQASVFNRKCRVFAPRYRQAHIKNFFTKDSLEARKAFELAYEDSRLAFEYYMQHWNKDRPIIIAGHSQGSFLAERLLKDYFQDKPLQKKLVVAYLPGWPVPKEYFTTLKTCTDSLQTGCLCSWRTLRKGFVPFYLKNEKGNSWVTNPLNWSSGPEYAPRHVNRGSVLKNFNRVYLNSTDAWIENGLLYVRRPKFPWSFLYLTRNYHVGDINLFYINLRKNVELRLKKYLGG